MPQLVELQKKEFVRNKDYNYENTNNPNSGRVVLKCGLQHEGILRKAGRDALSVLQTH